jgi:hypothetical protein
MTDARPHGSPDGEPGAVVSGPLVTRHAALFTDLSELHGGQAEVERHEVHASR